MTRREAEEASWVHGVLELLFSLPLLGGNRGFHFSFLIHLVSLCHFFISAFLQYARSLSLWALLREPEKLIQASRGFFCVPPGKLSWRIHMKTFASWLFRFSFAHVQLTPFHEEQSRPVPVWPWLAQCCVYGPKLSRICLTLPSNCTSNPNNGIWLRAKETHY